MRRSSLLKSCKVWCFCFCFVLQLWHGAPPHSLVYHLSGRRGVIGWTVFDVPPKSIPLGELVLDLLRAPVVIEDPDSVDLLDDANMSVIISKEYKRTWGTL